MSRKAISRNELKMIRVQRLANLDPKKFGRKHNFSIIIFFAISLKWQAYFGPKYFW